jgi:molecular chaperone DnaK (HSP70)
MQKFVIAFAVAIPVLAAILAAFGFQGRDIIVGIDLGTTYSTVAYRLNGELHVMRNSENSSVTPSIIALFNGAFVVGKQAANILRDDPDSCVFDAKRVIGRRWDDDTLQAEILRHNGRIVAHPTVKRDQFGKLRQAAKLASCLECEAEPAFVVRAGGSNPVVGEASRHVCLESGSVMRKAELMDWMQKSALDIGFLLEHPVNAEYLLITPAAAACLVIGELAASLERELGHKHFKSAIVTVPAEFNAAQRQVTTDAYSRAGITPSRVMHEPAAAAIAYGLHRQADVRYVLVFDMGGGTLDVSVLYAQKGAFTLLGTGGDAHLGGEDFDDCMLDIIERQRNTTAQTDSAEQYGRPADVCTPSVLRKEAERMKICLGDSAVSQVTWQCSVGGQVTHDTITREQFEGTCDALFRRTLQSVEDGLYSANLEATAIDEVVLVGGSSRLLKVRKLLEDVFHKPLRHTVDPDLAVAVGASMVVD